MALRFALLNAAHEGENNRRNFRRELDADLVEYDVVDGDVPTHTDFDAAVVTGSRASAYWDEPWISSLKEWLRRADEDGLPMLGVCFGHQVLADALGGAVAAMDDYEIGYRTVTHDGDSPLMAGVGEEFTVFTTHSDRVTELPPGADQFAENDYGVHGFRRGDAVGIQFHPEYDLATAEEIASGKDVSPEKERLVAASITDENFAAAREAKQLFGNFTERARRLRDCGDAPAACAAEPPVADSS
jgi:GMP synthase (glutamine-hydrolysing)